jgi:hypothetical protein
VATTQLVNNSASAPSATASQGTVKSISIDRVMREFGEVEESDFLRSRKLR